MPFFASTMALLFTCLQTPGKPEFFQLGITAAPFRLRDPSGQIVRIAILGLHEESAVHPAEIEIDFRIGSVSHQIADSQ